MDRTAPGSPAGGGQGGELVEPGAGDSDAGHSRCGQGEGQARPALLAVLLGAGLRRSEAAGLKFEDLQQRDGRLVVGDVGQP